MTQLAIEEEIFEYFGNGIDPSIVEFYTGHDIKIVRKYYKKFSAMKIHQNERGFIEQCKINLASASAALGHQILKLVKRQEALDRYFSTLPENAEPDTFLLKEYRELSKTIAQLNILKVGIENTPTADIHLNKMIKDMVKRNVPKLEN